MKTTFTGPTLFIGPATELLRGTDGGRFIFETLQLGPATFSIQILAKAVEINATIFGVCDPCGNCKTSDLLEKLTHRRTHSPPVIPKLIISHSSQHPGKTIEIRDIHEILIAEPLEDGDFELSFSPRRSLRGDEWFAGSGYPM
ncbi:MAG: hypothetical protein WCF92_01325 [bacterium]